MHAVTRFDSRVRRYVRAEDFLEVALDVFVATIREKLFDIIPFLDIDPNVPATIHTVSIEDTEPVLRESRS